MMEEKKQIRKLIISIFIILLIFLIGTFGYQTLEGWNFIDSLFFTVITMSTVGYSMPENVSTMTKLFTVGLIFSGLTVVLYAFSSLTSFIIEGEIFNLMGRRKMMKKINKMKDHTILIGAGKTANFVMLNLLKTNTDFVLLDINEENIKKLIEEMSAYDVPYIIGDVKEENSLLYAGVMHAKNVILTLPSDVDNLYAALTIKTLNPNVSIVSKVNEPQNVKKLIYAGIDKIVLTSEIAGNRLAYLATKPNVVTFLDKVTRAGEVEYILEEIKVPESSWMIDKTLREIALPKLVDLIIIAINKKDNKYIFNPNANHKIENGDTVVVLGKEHKITDLKKIINEKNYI